jgi:hypothetical protein
VCCAGIDEIRPAQLTDVSEALKNFRVGELESQLVDTNVIPDRVAQNLEAHGPSL